MILVVSKRLNLTPGPPTRQLGRQFCGRSNFWVELVKKGKSPSSLRWSNCRGPIWNSNILCPRRCGPTWWRRSSTWRTATARSSTTAGSSFPLPILRYDDLMRVRLFKLNAPKYKLVLPQNFRLKNDLTTGCDLLCLRLLRRRPLWSPVSWTARRTQVSAVAFYILLHLLRIGSLSIDRCNQISNNCRSISSDDTTFPAVPNINFAASGPFANHTPGETELSVDFIFSEDKSAASQDK